MNRIIKFEYKSKVLVTTEFDRNYRPVPRCCEKFFYSIQMRLSLLLVFKLKFSWLIFINLQLKW